MMAYYLLKQHQKVAPPWQTAATTPKSRTGSGRPEPSTGRRRKVSDPAFASGDFFDSRDLLQVRYEMVRVVRLGEATLAQAAARFGVSRPTCFRMVKAFDGGGLQELIPARRGPRGPHKISPEILRFVEDYKALHGRVGARRLVPLIEAEFGVRVHPRGLEKAIERGKKKSQEPGP